MKKSVTVGLEAGLEARPIALLVQNASQFASSIYLVIDEKRINAKSIMGIMAFNPSEGMSVSIVTEGSDEQEALLAIERFLVCE